MMKTIMKLEELTTIEQLSRFLEGTQAVIFKVNTLKEERYQWIQHELIRFDYRTLNKVKKGAVIRYLIKVSGYSRQQITRLIKQYRNTGHIKHHHVTSNGFKGKYTSEDIRLIARMDERHDTPCGQAIKKLCERAYQVFGEEKYKRLSNISTSHLYNLRKSKAYSRTRNYFEKTRAKSSSIGERRKPIQRGVLGIFASTRSTKAIRARLKGSIISTPLMK